MPNAPAPSRPTGGVVNRTWLSPVVACCGQGLHLRIVVAYLPAGTACLTPPIIRLGSVTMFGSDITLIRYSVKHRFCLGCRSSTWAVIDMPRFSVLLSKSIFASCREFNTNFYQDIHATMYFPSSHIMQSGKNSYCMRYIEWSMFPCIFATSRPTHHKPTAAFALATKTPP